MKDNQKLLEAYKYRANMLTYLFGSADSEAIENDLSQRQFEVFDDKYVNGVFNNIRIFPITLRNVMNNLPYLEYDVPLLSEQYLEGYTFGFIRRIRNYCEENGIGYTYEDDILFVDNYLLSCNNDFFYNIYEIDSILSELKMDKTNVKLR